MNDESPNRYTIERLPIICNDRCEHADLECTDPDATADDMIMLPDTFLVQTANCTDGATHIITVDDEWVREMGCDEPDTYLLCESHARIMLDSLDPNSAMP